MKKFQEFFFYHFYKTLFGLGLRIYYKNISVSGLDKIPLDQPIITTSNHPTGLMDVLLASYFIKRQIKFTAAGALFKDRLQAAFLTSVGTIPVYRRKDSPDEQDKNVESFEYCFQELESGGAIGFYPEGTSHPEPWVNPIKTGAARVALQAEERNNFRLSLLIIPIGINSLYPGKFRGSVLVNIGDPIEVKKYQAAYQQDAVEAVKSLTAEIQRGMEACTFHLQNKIMLDIFDILKTVGVEEIKLGDEKITNNTEKIYLISKKLEQESVDIKDSKGKASARLNSLSRDLSDFKNRMQKLNLVGHPFQGIRTVVKFISLLLILILSFPLVMPFTIADILPSILSKNLGRKLAGKDISLIPAGRLMMGTVIFILFYLFVFIVLGLIFNFLAALVICFTLIIGGYLTLWYWEALKGFTDAFKKILLWLTKRKEIQDLIERRSVLFNELKISLF